MDPNPEEAPQEKKPYVPPELIVYGTLSEITGKHLGPADGKMGAGSFE